ncbi:hypothetical protein CN273_00060 [Bacillus thuringiensis]|uniref:hypothetical protein n=1 Tax=Bacillus thuringiensis TaxID=1428 RepID=UPI000BF5CDCC|nr:hypothetical protein [Bacillus thuringiensis]PFB89776.1 hypothetical protein CN273_00060 [Bacillus thuringiensis]
MFYSNDINNDNDSNVRLSNINTFHEHTNGGGANFRMFSGDSMDYVGNVWNDQISSVTVAPRTLVILFEHRGFRGATNRLTNNGDYPYLFNLSRPWNDITSSIATYRLG